MTTSPPSTYPRRRLVALLVALPACRGASSQASPPDLAASAALPVAPSSAAAPEASTAPLDAGAQASPAVASSAAPPALDEPVVDRRIFREVLVGGLVYPPVRRTWTFTRGATRARLQAVCQRATTGGTKATPARASGGMALNGEENDESRWLAPVVTDYAGVQTSKSPLAYRFSVASGLDEARACASLRDVLLLSCRPAAVPVLRAGAALVVGKKGPDDEMPPARWAPGSTESVASLRCEVSVEGDKTGFESVTLWHSVAFVLAAGRNGSPGVEWAFENSDMVVQQGAYRWMPAR